jgi:formamidopyrimidine-DNA glycosylase
VPDRYGRHRHDRVIFVCEGGELRYNNMCRFGGIWLARDSDERDAVTGPLGPDAAGIGRVEFESLLRGRRGSVKAALMDQCLIAGVGNLLSDEITWRARPPGDPGAIAEPGLQRATIAGRTACWCPRCQR